MKPLDDRERRFAYLGAGIAAAVSVALWAPSFDERAAVALSGIGMVMAALLALAATRRHRLFTGLACILLAFGPWGVAWVVGLPYLMLAAWLALRSNRLQPQPVPGADEHGGIAEQPVARVPKEVRAPRTPRRRRRGSAGDDGPEDGDEVVGAPSQRKPPAPSKRYTPPQRRR